MLVDALISAYARSSLDMFYIIQIACELFPHLDMKIRNPYRIDMMEWLK